VGGDPGRPRQAREHQQARGKGGFRRTTWDEVLEIVAASCLHTAKRWGPDRVFGFSPIPAMSYLSYAGGSRFLQLFGGVNMSFYDWYADLPNAFPEIWGEQTDVCESADWYNSRFIVSMGANLNMTRTPDVHFISEARHEGAKFVVLSPDFSQVAKYADWWIPVEAGQDTALWMAVNHVILTEFHANRQVPYFVDYLRRTTDCPFLVELKQGPDGCVPRQFLRANRVERYANVEHGDWKMLMWEANARAPRMPKGSIGFRWAEQEKGRWNLKLEDGLDDSPIDPVLTFLDAQGAEVVQVAFHEFAGQTTSTRGVPARWVDTTAGDRTLVATVYDLLFAQFGVGRGLEGDYPVDYDDPGRTRRPGRPAAREPRRLAAGRSSHALRRVGR
jgi:nitrate reductase alpha subunit